MKAKQFEIWIADLNPQIGTEPGKVRPVLIVQTDMLNKVHPSTLICPITTRVQKGSEILRVHIHGGTCGLSESCDIMIDQIRAIDNKRLVTRLGLLPHDLACKVQENLKVLLELE